MTDDASAFAGYAALTDAELRELAASPPSEPSARAALRAELERRVAAKRQKSNQLVAATSDAGTAPILDESIMAWVPQFHVDGFTRTVGDLVFTNRRVLFVKTMPLADLFGGLLAVLIARESQKASEDLRAQPIASIETRVDPNHRYLYFELERIVVKARWFRSSLIIVQPRVGKRITFRGALARLDDLLGKVPSLTQAGAPIEVQ